MTDGDSMINENINQGDLIVFEKVIKLEMVRLAALQSMIMLLHVKNSTVMIIITALYYNQLILNIHPL